MVEPIECAGAEFFPDRVVVRLDVDDAMRAAKEEVKRLVGGNWKTDRSAMQHPVSRFVKLEIKRRTHGEDHPQVVEGLRDDPSSRIKDAVLLSIAEVAVTDGLETE